MDEPFFPAPRAKELRGYRDPARELEAGEGLSSTTTTTSAPSEPPPKRVVIAKRLPAAHAADEELIRLRDRRRLGFVTERAFWSRHSFFARHPRVVGGVIAALGVYIILAAINTLRHGGTYGVKATMFAPLCLCSGIFIVIAGYPKGLTGRTPTWWGFGFFFATLLGAAGGVVLLASVTY